MWLDWWEVIELEVGGEERGGIEVGSGLGGV